MFLKFFFDFSGSIYAYTHVSKINYTPQLSIWSPPVSLCPPDIHGGAETSCGNCFVCSACVNMISENPGFLERRLTRISILGREVRRRHGTRRATRPAPLARGPLETRSCNAADPTRPGGGTGIAAGERNEQRNPIPIPEEALRGTKNEANKTRSQFRVQSTEHAHTESDPVYR
jgi:hypothetical protein